MSDTIYREIIIDHYKNPRNFGKIKNPDFKSEVSNPLCGDKIKMFINIEDDKIRDMKFMGCGCVISIATASILTEKLKAMKASEILRMSNDDALSMLEIKLSPNRQKCALLGFWAIKKAISGSHGVKK